MKPINIDNMIDSIRNFELTVALLYETFSRIFPPAQEKWLSFADEERIHAKWLAELKQHHNNELISFNETKITIHSINVFIEFLQEQIDRARNDKLDLKEAILIALGIENAILEKSLVKLFSFTSPKAIAVRMKLTRETRIHREKLLLWLEVLENESQSIRQ